MKRLIFFSGGVESTPLLLEADPMDVVVTILPSYPIGVPTFRRWSAEQIAEKLGFTVNYAQIKIPIEPEPYNFVHQFVPFMAIAHLWVVKDPSITEIWAGRNNREIPPTLDSNDIRTKQLQAWRFMHPDIPFIHPLEKLSAQQHWDMIPDDIKPLVSSCIFHNQCGTCFKCEELKAKLKQ